MSISDNPDISSFCGLPGDDRYIDHAREIEQRAESNRLTTPAEATAGLARHEKAQALEQALDERGRR